jgi:hypothetical protein
MTELPEYRFNLCPKRLACKGKHVREDIEMKDLSRRGVMLITKSGDFAHGSGPAGLPIWGWDWSPDADDATAKNVFAANS